MQKTAWYSALTFCVHVIVITCHIFAFAYANFPLIPIYVVSCNGYMMATVCSWNEMWKRKTFSTHFWTLGNTNEMLEMNTVASYFEGADSIGFDAASATLFVIFCCYCFVQHWLALSMVHVCNMSFLCHFIAEWDISPFLGHNLLLGNLFTPLAISTMYSCTSLAQMNKNSIEYTCCIIVRFVVSKKRNNKFHANVLANEMTRNFFWYKP